MIVPVSEWCGAAPKWICLANTGRKTCGSYEVMLWHLWLAEYNSETYCSLAECFHRDKEIAMLLYIFFIVTF